VDAFCINIIFNSVSTFTQNVLVNQKLSDTTRAIALFRGVIKN